jgi:hypothetical protein
MSYGHPEPAVPAGTLIVPNRVLPLMLRVMETVVVPDTEERKSATQAVLIY